MATERGKWLVYIGMYEQIADMQLSKNGWIWGNDQPDEGSESVQYGFPSSYVQKNMTRYLIIPDDPLREMKIRQATTGQPVWERYNGTAETSNKEFHDLCVLARDAYPEGFETYEPHWHIPYYDFSFTPFKGG